ncbi:2-acylglycerol O-acyltransferase 2-A-like isoform X2 [Daktulosphaira vitifoliae]|uniref:2-acylglycerol O-acyltransferase 2-A-like isoform X2 n=1 Tax=Daktulosphaira vitifoliae TaxID=58002 RepID=UPI0021A99096|nr:2-acylglycerol O-acyltransferase 2-A-like isoform X2 [Daktulosphaira vitifoliae]
MGVKDIEFAPLCIPLSRRLETLSVAIMTSLFLFTGISGTIILVYIILCTRFWWFGLAYISWMIIDRNIASSGNPSYYYRIRNIRNWTLWVLVRRYFKIQLVKTHDLPANKSYIFATHPHGTFCIGAFNNILTNASPFRKFFPGLQTFMMILNVHFYMPFHRELYISMDGKKGNVAVLMVGGVSEAFQSFPGPVHLVVNKRKGFVRVALKTGASIVPVFSFGENNTYHKYDVPTNSIWYKILRLLKWKNDRSIPNGRGLLQYSFGLMPRRCPIVTVVGKPIDVPKITNPTNYDIEKYHKLYVAELINVFEKHKAKYSTYPEEMNLILD